MITNKPADESLKITTKHASNNALACPGVSHETHILGSCAYEQRRNTMKLNRNTKKAQDLIERFYNSEFETLEECYNSCSYAKRMAYYNCLYKCSDMDGWRFRIISFNTMSFTCGWLYEDKETGVIMLNVETYRNTYTIEY